jgi:hypothetical protein
MNLNKPFFNPTYSKVLLLFAGISVGITVSFKSWIVKIGLLLFALGLAAFSDKIKDKEDGKND